MNIYYISRIDDCSYDEYDSAVVYAESKLEATRIHPGSKGRYGPDSAWCHQSDVRALLIAQNVIVPSFCQYNKVLVASFNAG